MIKEKSCGGVILKKVDDKYLVLLIKHNVGHWSFPKGHVENNETEEETAKREIMEETGLLVSLVPGFRKVVTYSPKDGVLKDVVFFLALSNSDVVSLQEEEVSDYNWCSFSEAYDLITYDSDKEVLNEVICFLNDIL